MSAIAILYILKEYSDEAHPLSSNACIPLLEQVYDIKINRGTLSAYIKQLRNFGIDIQTTNRGYYLRYTFCVIWFIPHISYATAPAFSSSTSCWRRRADIIVKILKTPYIFRTHEKRKTGSCFWMWISSWKQYRRIKWSRCTIWPTIWRRSWYEKRETVFSASVLYCWGKRKSVSDL